MLKYSSFKVSSLYCNTVSRWRPHQKSMSHCNRSCVSRQSETVPAFEKITGWIDKRNKKCGEEASRPQMKCCAQVPSAGSRWNRDEDMPGGAVVECLTHYLPLRAQSKGCWRAPAASENNNERKITGSARVLQLKRADMIFISCLQEGIIFLLHRWMCT